MLKNNINIMVGTKVSSCKELIVWQKAMDLVAAVYKLTDNYPKTELYGLVSQTKRSAISIVSNIAEGRRRGTKKDFRHFLIISGEYLMFMADLRSLLYFIMVSTIWAMWREAPGAGSATVAMLRLSLIIRPGKASTSCKLVA